MTCCLKLPSVSLIFVYWFAVDAFLGIANWWFCISREPMDVAPTSAVLEGIFALISFFVYFGVASPLLYYPHYYRERLRTWDKVVNRPAKKKDLGARTWRSYTILGIWVYFASALPRFLMEYHILFTYGWTYRLQGVAFFSSLITNFNAFLTVWGSYLWRASKKFQQMSVNSMPDSERLFYLSAYRTGPYAIKYDSRGFPLWASGVTPAWREPFYHLYPDHLGKNIGTKICERDEDDDDPGIAAAGAAVKHPAGMFMPPLADPDLRSFPAYSQS
eukprot:gene3692-5745_t